MDNCQKYLVEREFLSLFSVSECLENIISWHIKQEIEKRENDFTKQERNDKAGDLL